MGDETVLVVDDEPDVTDLYARLLADEYDVLKAYGGREALETMRELDNGTVDVVLLDRQMPEMDGDETLSRIREAGYDCRVAMVTAIDPDFDVVDMPFDDYVTKPLAGEDLIDVVERLVMRKEYADDVQEHFSLAARKAAIEDEKSASELENSPEYAELIERLAAVESETPTPGDAEEWDALLREAVDGGNSD